MSASVTPTLAGFITWAQSALGIPANSIAPDSVWYTYAFNVALAIVSPDLAAAATICSPPAPSPPPSNPIYMLAVYNLAADNLINFAQDPPPSTFFQTARTNYKIYSFVAGVIQSAGDEGTNENLLVPDFMKNITMANLQSLKTPWGRQYMAFAQSLGTLWGLT